ncbi:formate dehydrogenase accessory sulfurtransferase FdhD [Acidomonas methanolica]|uniref:formate dehydrogenase accessory sulfurtransferase FdhD n=1 Tax=Acidomonas methanolica TaxID=437 RepID=UPI003333BF4D
MTLPAAARIDALRLAADDVRRVALGVAEEVPVSLVFNELHPYAVMMASPLDLEDFARGFAVTERIVSTPGNFLGCEVHEVENGMEIRARITGADFSRLLHRGRRAMTGRTGCGLCGVDTIAALEQPVPRLAQGGGVTLDAIRRALAALPGFQCLNAETHMVHAAAWSLPDGEIVLVREDVGRHNALDKLIGARFAAGRDFAEGFCLLTSRYSFEMAEKTAIAGMGLVVAVSAPTARALRVAEAAGQTVLAIARTDSQILFCGSDRIAAARPAEDVSRGTSVEPTGQATL